MSDIAFGSMSAELIQTPRLVLEPLRIDHATELASALDDHALHEFTGGLPLTASEMTEQFKVRVNERSPDGTEVWLNWVIRYDSQVIGYVQATVTKPVNDVTADIAWVVATPWQGQGFAKEASQAMADWLVRAGVTVLAANIHPRHVASAAVARSLGLAPTEDVVDGERRWCR